MIRSTPTLGTLAPLGQSPSAAGKQPKRTAKIGGLTGSRSCPVVRPSLVGSSSTLHPKDSRRPSVHHSAFAKPKVRSDGSVKACAVSMTIAAPAAAEPPAEEPVHVNTWQERLQAKLKKDSDDVTTKMQVVYVSV